MASTFYCKRMWSSIAWVKKGVEKKYTWLKNEGFKFIVLISEQCFTLISSTVAVASKTQDSSTNRRSLFSLYSSLIFGVQSSGVHRSTYTEQKLRLFHCFLLSWLFFCVSLRRRIHRVVLISVRGLAARRKSWRRPLCCKPDLTCFVFNECLTNHSVKMMISEVVVKKLLFPLLDLLSLRLWNF